MFMPASRKGISLALFLASSIIWQSFPLTVVARESKAERTLDLRAAAESLNPPPQPVAPTISATLVDSFAVAGDDADSDGKADPGDKITYTATITNSGTDATGVSFSDTVD